MLYKCVVNFGRGGGILKHGETIRGSAGCNLSSIPDRLGVDVGQKLRQVDSLGSLDRLEIRVPCCTGQGGRRLTLPHEAGCMVMDAS